MNNAIKLNSLQILIIRLSELTYIEASMIMIKVNVGATKNSLTYNINMDAAQFYYHFLHRLIKRKTIDCLNREFLLGSNGREIKIRFVIQRNNFFPTHRSSRLNIEF